MGIEMLCHICTASEWEAAQASGIYRAASLETEGFIHCSRPDQIPRVANLYFSGIANLLLLWIDPARVVETIRWEIVDGDTYPHIYGGLNLDAIYEVEPLIPQTDGTFVDIQKR